MAGQTGTRKAAATHVLSNNLDLQLPGPDSLIVTSHVCLGLSLRINQLYFSKSSLVQTQGIVFDLSTPKTTSVHTQERALKLQFQLPVALVIHVDTKREFLVTSETL